MLASNFYKHGVPPKVGMSEVELLTQMRRLSELDTEEQIGIDETDGALVYRNTLRISAADNFFPNIFVAKDKIGSKWLSVIDQVSDPSTSIDVMWQVIRNDRRKVYAKPVPENGLLEDYLRENKHKYGFIFFKPEAVKKNLHKKFRAKVGVLKGLVKKRVITSASLKDVSKLSDNTIVYLRQYKLDQKVFPAAFVILQSTMVSAPTNFPTAVARAIYQRYAMPSKKNEEVIIWDPSMGFGGRLLGALSVLDRRIHYIGTDPNSLNYLSEDKSSRYEILEKVFKGEVRERRDTFKGTYIQSGSEEADKDRRFQALKGKVDLVFTSPPYFAAELYSEDKTQSSLKFSSYHNWRSGFLAPTLSIAANWVRKGGYVIFNIANSGGYPLEEDTRLICRQLGLNLVATEKMAIATGASSQKKIGGALRTWNFVRVDGRMRKYEPVFVFRKIKDTPLIDKFNYSKLHTAK
jgi:hypothetical protein